MRNLTDHATGAAWVQPWTDRTEQIIWVLAYERDLDADFLAIYRIDLEEDDVTARRYFTLAHRLPAYSGVLAARAEAQSEDSGSTPSSSSGRASTAASSGRPQYQSAEALAIQHPTEIELVKVTD